MSEVVKVCKVHGELKLEDTVRYKKAKTGKIYYFCKRCRAASPCGYEGCQNSRDSHGGLCGSHRYYLSKNRETGLTRKEIYEKKLSKLPAGILKICKRHGQLSSEDVYRQKNKEYSLGFLYVCKICSLEGRHFKAADSLDPDAYKMMREEQEDKCKICHKEETAKGRGGKLRPLSVDHDHSSKKIRGLLCHTCNVLLGNAKDSIRLLLSAVDYLKEYQ